MSLVLQIYTVIGAKIEPHQLRGSVVMLLVPYHYVTHSAFMRLTSIQASITTYRENDVEIAEFEHDHPANYAGMARN